MYRKFLCAVAVFSVFSVFGMELPRFANQVKDQRVKDVISQFQQLEEGMSLKRDFEIFSAFDQSLSKLYNTGCNILLERYKGNLKHPKDTIEDHFGDSLRGALHSVYSIIGYREALSTDKSCEPSENDYNLQKYPKYFGMINEKDREEGYRLLGYALEILRQGIGEGQKNLYVRARDMLDALIQVYMGVEFPELLPYNIKLKKEYEEWKHKELEKEQADDEGLGIAIGEEGDFDDL